MKNFSRRLAISSVVPHSASRLVEISLGVALVLSCAVVVFFSQVVSRAQSSSVQSKVSTVSARPSGTGTIVSIAADSPLSRTQNWWDAEGYHLVFPNTVPAESLKAARGVRVRRVGTSMEVLLQTKPGSKVSLEPDGNLVNLVIDKALETRPLTGEDQDGFRASGDSSGETHTAGNLSAPTERKSELPPEPFPRQLNFTPADAKNSAVGIVAEDDGLAASIFSGTSVFVLMALGLFGLLVSRKFSTPDTVLYPAETYLADDDIEWEDVTEEPILDMHDTKHAEPRSSLVKSGPATPTNGSSRQPAVRIPVAGPTSLYGAYRIDQEVSKLILGEPHRADVLASRAIDDRRAIENSLMKGLNSFDLDEAAERRARQALEEYGFVARQCALLLLAPDPFDRTSAARCLGEIKSEDALPFLLESLHDPESIVRNQAVLSIGELKHPSAIGALLDIARTCPDVSSALLSRTLSACSVEGLDFFDVMSPDLAQLGIGRDMSVIEQITHLEPSDFVEELPESCDDEELAQALSSLDHNDAQERSEALKTLAQFRCQSSVAAISRVARHDPEPNIRAIAVASLGSIDHESVFPVILISMVDDTREVRASAARALNRLCVDRADAYVRVIETGDEEMIREVAQACVQAGIVSQNLDRLASSDYRQAYETFSLICLLAKANMNEPVLNAITEHSNLDVSIKAVHLLGSTGQPGSVEKLRQLAARGDLDHEVKTAVDGVLHKLEQAKPKEDDQVEAGEANGELSVDSSEVETTDDDAGSEMPMDLLQPSEPEHVPLSGREIELKRDQLEL
jgi:HEAT repeat protein